MTIQLTPKTKFILFLITIAIAALIFLIKNYSRNDSRNKRKIESKAQIKTLPQITESKKESVSKPAEVSPYLKKYAGVYIIKVDVDKSGKDEVLNLKPNGDCIWSYDGQNERGTWTAEKGRIHTTTPGHTDKEVTEDFELRNGKFVSTFSGIRYLKKK